MSGTVEQLDRAMVRPGNRFRRRDCLESRLQLALAFLVTLLAAVLGGDICRGIYLREGRLASRRYRLLLARRPALTGGLVLLMAPK